MFSPQEGQAVIVALHRAALDCEIKSKGAAAARDTANATLFGMYANQCKALAVKFQNARAIEIATAAERDILVSALRHTAQFQWDLAQSQKGFEKGKRENFSAAFGALADRIAEATKGPSQVLH